MEKLIFQPGKCWRISCYVIRAYRIVIKSSVFSTVFRPALDVVSFVSAEPATTAVKIVDLLDQVFGSVRDGYELLLKVYSCFQDNYEETSAYVQKLYSLLIDAHENKGIDDAH